MIIKIKEYKDLPFEVGKTYQTRICSAWVFTITKIFTNTLGNVKGFEGIYPDSPHLGICPIGKDRLIPEQTYSEREANVCIHCGKEIF